MGLTQQSASERGTSRSPSQGRTPSQQATPGNQAAQEALPRDRGAPASDTPTLDAAGLGSDTEGSEDAALRADVEELVDDSPGWIREINTMVNPLLDGQTRLEGIDAPLDTIVDRYASARETHEAKVAEGQRSERAAQMIQTLVLGSLPGLGNVARMMAPSGMFFGPLNRLAGQAASRTMGALSPGTGTAEAAGESNEAFALRAERSRSGALRSVLRCFQASSNLAQVANEARELLQELDGDEVSDEARQQARQMGEIHRAWPDLQSSMQRLAAGVVEAQNTLAEIMSTWTTTQLEIYVWLLWVGGLGEDGAYHLAPDPIEQHLRGLGITGPGSVTGADLQSAYDLGGLGGLYLNPQQVMAVNRAADMRGTVQRILRRYAPTPLGNPSG